MLRDKQRQIGVFVLAFNGLIAIYAIYLSAYNFAFGWLIGLAFGFVFQRSRFCTVAAVRDVFLLRNFALAKGVLVYLMIATLLFGILYLLSQYTVLTIGGRLNRIGLLTIIGAFIFGIGMVIAGGCASGTLIRMGEGLVMQWWSIVGLAFGLLIGTWQYPLYQRYNLTIDPVFLPDYFGIFGAVALQIAIFAGIYTLFRRFEVKHNYVFDTNSRARTESASTSETVPAVKVRPRAVYRRICERLLKPWSYTWGAISLASLTALVFLWNQIWGITNGLTHIFAGVTNLFFPDISHWYFFERIVNQDQIFFRHPMVPLVVAMVVGSFMSSLLAREFRIRKVAHTRYVVSALAGGFLMGIGARMANGCNVSAVMSGIPSMSLHGWVFLVCMVFGVLVGIKLLMRFLVTH